MASRIDIQIESRFNNSGVAAAIRSLDGLLQTLGRVNGAAARNGNAGQQFTQMASALKQLNGASTQAAGNLTKIGNGAKAAAAGANQATQAIRQVNAAVKEATAAQGTLNKAYDQRSSAEAKVRESASQLKTAYDQLQAAERELAVLERAGTASLGQKQAALQRYNNALKASNAAAKGFASAEREMASAQKTHGAALGQFKSAADKAGDALDHLQDGSEEVVGALERADAVLKSYQTHLTQFGTQTQQTANQQRQFGQASQQAGQMAQHAAQGVLRVSQAYQQLQQQGRTATQVQQQQAAAQRAAAQQAAAAQRAQQATAQQTANAIRTAATVGRQLITALQQVAQAAIAAARALGGALAGALRTVSSLFGVVANGATRFANLMKALDATGRSAQQFGRNVASGVSQANSALERTAAGWSTLMLGQQAMQSGESIWRALGSQIQEFAEYEKAAQRAAVAGSTTPAVVDSVVEGIARGDYGRPVMGFSLEDLARGLYYYESAIGQDLNEQNAQQLTQALLPMLEMAQFTETSPEQAIKGVLNAAQEFGIYARDLETAGPALQEVSEMFTYLANETSQEVPDIIEFFKMVGPLANQMLPGDSMTNMRDVMASMYAMSEMGLKGGNAGRGLAQLFTSMLDPTDKMNELSSQLWGGDINETFFDEQGKLKGGMEGMLQPFLELSAEEWARTAAALFTNNATRDIVPMIAQMRQNPDMWGDVMGELAGQGPAALLDSIGAFSNDSVWANLQNTANAWDTMANAIIRSVEGPLKGALQTFANIFFEATDVIRQFPEIGSVFAGIATAAAGILTTAGALATLAGMVLLVQRAMLMSGSAAGVFTGLLGALPMIVAVGIPVLAALAAAVVALGVAWQENFLGIREAVEGFDGDISTALTPAIERVFDVVSTGAEAFKEFVSGILLGVGPTQTLGRVLDDVFGDLIGSAIYNGLLDFADVMDTLRDRIVDFATSAATSLPTVLSGLRASLQLFFEELLFGVHDTALNDAVTALGELFNVNLGVGLTRAADLARNALATITQAARQFFAVLTQEGGVLSNIGQNLSDFGRQILGAVDLDAALDFGRGLAEGVAQGFAGAIVGALRIGEAISAAFARLPGVLGQVGTHIQRLSQEWLNLEITVQGVGQAIGVVIGAYLGGRLVAAILPFGAALRTVALQGVAFAASLVAVGARIAALGLSLAATVVQFIAQTAAMAANLAVTTVLTGAKLALAAAEAAAAAGILASAAAAAGAAVAFGALVAVVGVVIASLVAIGAAFVVALATSEEFRNNVVAIGEALLTGLVVGLAAALPAFQSLIETIKLVAAVMASNTEGITTFAAAFGLVAGVIAKAAEGIVTGVLALNLAVGNAVAALGPIWTGLFDIWTGDIEAGFAILSSVFVAGILGMVQAGFSAVGDISATVPGVSGIFEKMGLIGPEDWDIVARATLGSAQTAFRDIYPQLIEATMGDGVTASDLILSDPQRAKTDAKAALGTLVEDFKTQAETYKPEAQKALADIFGFDPSQMDLGGAELDKILGANFDAMEEAMVEFDRLNGTNMTETLRSMRTLYGQAAAETKSGWQVIGDAAAAASDQAFRGLTEEAAQAAQQAADAFVTTFAEGLSGLAEMDLPSLLGVMDATNDVDITQGLAGYMGAIDEALSAGLGEEGVSWQNSLEVLADVAGVTGDQAGDLLGENFHQALIDSPGLQRAIQDTGLDLATLLEQVPTFIHDSKFVPLAQAALLENLAALPEGVYSNLDLLGEEYNKIGLDYAKLVEFAISNAMAGQDWDLQDYLVEALQITPEQAQQLVDNAGLTNVAQNMGTEWFAGLADAMNSAGGEIPALAAETWGAINDSLIPGMERTVALTQEQFNEIPPIVRAALANAGYEFVIGTESWITSIDTASRGIGQALSEGMTVAIDGVDAAGMVQAHLIDPITGLSIPLPAVDASAFLASVQKAKADFDALVQGTTADMGLSPQQQTAVNTLWREEYGPQVEGLGQLADAASFIDQTYGAVADYKTAGADRAAAFQQGLAVPIPSPSLIGDGSLPALVESTLGTTDAWRGYGEQYATALYEGMSAVPGWGDGMLVGDPSGGRPIGGEPATEGTNQGDGVVSLPSTGSDMSGMVEHYRQLGAQAAQAFSTAFSTALSAAMATALQGALGGGQIGAGGFMPVAGNGVGGPFSTLGQQAAQQFATAFSTTLSTEIATTIAGAEGVPLPDVSLNGFMTMGNEAASIFGEAFKTQVATEIANAFSDGSQGGGGKAQAAPDMAWQGKGRLAAIEFGEGFKAQLSTALALAFNLTSLQTTINTQMQGITAALTAWVSAWNAILLTFPPQAAAAGVAAGSGFLNGMNPGFQSAVAALGAYVSAMVAVVMTLPPQFAAAGVAAGSGFQNGMNAGMQAAVNAIGAFASAIIGRINALASEGAAAAYNAGMAIGHGLANGISAAIPAVTAAADQLVAEASRAANAAAEVASPSELFRRETGLPIGLGVAQGIIDAGPAVNKAAGDLATGAANSAGTAADSAMSSVGEKLRSRAEEIASALREKFGMAAPSGDGKPKLGETAIGMAKGGQGVDVQSLMSTMGYGSIGQGMGAGVGQGISTAVPEAATAMEGLVTETTQAGKTAAGIAAGQGQGKKGQQTAGSSTLTQQEIGQPLGQGVADGIGTASPQVGTAMGETVDGAITAGKTAAGIGGEGDKQGQASGSSTVAANEVGAPITQGIADGVSQFHQQVSDAVQSVIGGGIAAGQQVSQDAGAEMVAPMQTEVPGAVNSLADAINQAVQGLVESIRAQVQEAIGQLNALGTAATDTANAVEGTTSSDLSTSEGKTKTRDGGGGNETTTPTTTTPNTPYNPNVGMVSGGGSAPATSGGTGSTFSEGAATGTTTEDAASQRRDAREQYRKDALAEKHDYRKQLGEQLRIIRRTQTLMKNSVRVANVRMKRDDQGVYEVAEQLTRRFDLLEGGYIRDDKKNKLYSVPENNKKANSLLEALGLSGETSLKDIRASREFDANDTGGWNDFWVNLAEQQAGMTAQEIAKSLQPQNREVVTTIEGARRSIQDLRIEHRNAMQQLARALKSTLRDISKGTSDSGRTEDSSSDSSNEDSTDEGGGGGGGRRPGRGGGGDGNPRNNGRGGRNGRNNDEEEDSTPNNPGVSSVEVSSRSISALTLPPPTTLPVIDDVAMLDRYAGQPTAANETAAVTINFDGDIHIHETADLDKLADRIDFLLGRKLGLAQRLDRTNTDRR